MAKYMIGLKTLINTKPLTNTHRDILVETIKGVLKLWNKNILVNQPSQGVNNPVFPYACHHIQVQFSYLVIYLCGRGEYLYHKVRCPVIPFPVLL